MLDQGKENIFRYDVQDILEDSNTEAERQPALVASFVTKAVRLGIDDARLFIREKGEEGILEDETRDRLLRLLDRYTRVR